MNRKTDTIIVGGGQAGLATSYHLKQRAHDHLVLERSAEAGSAWRNERWDSFTLVTPNWSVQMPGAAYQGSHPDGFMPRDEIAAYFRGYAQRFQLPIQFQTEVTAVEQDSDSGGFSVRTDHGDFQARQVVIATGFYQKPRIPAWGSDISSGITQLHSSRYRNPSMLPPGAVLVVGSGQSGCQIAEELYQHGRKVYLSTGSCGRSPRRYRGKDVYRWLYLTGFADRTVDQLPSPRARFMSVPHLSGAKGGHDLNLHQFARDGVTLLGHLTGGRDTMLELAPDLKENLARADKFESDLLAMIDSYIARSGLDAPSEELPQLRDGYDRPTLTELDLAAEGVKAIIWATGYRFDYGLVRLPVCDGDGFPIQDHGRTKFDGLYFVGLPWLSKQKSALVLGVGEDAAYLASEIAADHR